MKVAMHAESIGSANPSMVMVEGSGLVLLCIRGDVLIAKSQQLHGGPLRPVRTRDYAKHAYLGRMCRFTEMYDVGIGQRCFMLCIADDVTSR